jgi:predicted phosphodiesterase
MRYLLLTACIAGVLQCRANYREWQSPGCTVGAPELTILQFSDTHVRDTNDARWLRSQLDAAIVSNRPGILVHTGDITLEGSDAQWDAFAESMTGINPPLEYVWGNHDMPLKKSQYASGGLSHFRDMGSYRLIFIDTAWDGPFVGSYTSIPDSELDKIKIFANTEKRILIFAHHPLGKDAPHFRLKNADKLLALFNRAKVLGIFTGHFHGAYLAPEDGLIFAGVAPLTTHQRNHTWSQTKGYRLIEVQGDCLRTLFVPVKIP